MDVFSVSERDLQAKLAAGQAQDLLNAAKKLVDAVKSLTPPTSASEIEAMKASALRLWNNAIEWSQNNIVHADVQILVRHAVADLLRKLAKPDEDEDSLILSIAVHLRVAHLYAGQNNFIEAEGYFSHAERIEHQLNHRFPRSGDTTKRVLHSFSLLLWQAEMYSSRSQFLRAFDLMVKAKELLPQLHEHIEPFVEACYRPALALVTKSTHNEAKQWLMLALAALSLQPERNKRCEALILRLLSKSMLDANDDVQRALSQIQQANQLAPDAAGVLIECEVFIRLAALPQALQCFRSLVALLPFDLERCLGAAQLFATHKCLSEASEAYRILAEHLKHPTANPADFARVQVARFGWLLSSTQETFALSLLEEVMTEHARGAAKLTTEALTDLLALIWNAGVEAYNSKDFTRAETWFSMCPPLISSDDIAKRAKTMRVLARCFMARDHLEGALSMAQQAASLSPQHMPSQWLLLQVLTKLNKTEEVIACLSRLGPDSSVVLELAAKQSFDMSQFGVTVAALELLLKHTKFENKAAVPMHLPQLACALIRLFSSQSDESILGCPARSNKLLMLFKLVSARLAAFQKFYPSQGANPEIDWLITFAWNTGIDAGKAGLMQVAGELFLRAQELLHLLPAETESIDRQRACLVNHLLAACEVVDPRHAPELLGCINMCRQLTAQVASMRSELPSDAQALNLLYFLEAKVKSACGEPVLPIVHAAVASKNPSANVLLLIAHVAKDQEATREAYKHALRLLRDSPADGAKCLSLICRLVELVPKREEAQAFFDDAIQLLNTNNTLPSDNLNWLSVAAFNNAAYCTSLKRYSAAERWMAKAMAISRHLNNKPFESEVIAAYDQITAKVRAGAK